MAANNKIKKNIPNGYDLALMLLKDKNLENNVLYLGFHDDVLHYKCIDPDGKYQENTITWQELHENGAANELKPENGQLLQEFEAIKTAILKATSKRGHTLPYNNIKKNIPSQIGQFHAEYSPKDNKFSTTSKGWHKFYLFRNSMRNHMTKVARAIGFGKLDYIAFDDKKPMGYAEGFVAFMGMCILIPFVLAGVGIGFVTGIFDGLYRMIKRSTTTQKTATEINTNLEKLQKEINNDSYSSDTNDASLSYKILSKYEKKSHIFGKSTASGNLHKDLKNNKLLESMKLQKIKEYKLSTTSSGIHRNMGKGMDDSINEAMEEHYNPTSCDI